MGGGLPGQDMSAAEKSPSNEAGPLTAFRFKLCYRSSFSETLVCRLNKHPDKPRRGRVPRLETHSGHHRAPRQLARHILIRSAYRIALKPCRAFKRRGRRANAENRVARANATAPSQATRRPQRGVRKCSYFSPWPCVEGASPRDGVLEVTEVVFCFWRRKSAPIGSNIWF